MNKFNMSTRRDFLRTSLVGAPLSLALPTLLSTPAQAATIPAGPIARPWCLYNNSGSYPAIMNIITGSTYGTGGGYPGPPWVPSDSASGKTASATENSVINMRNTGFEGQLAPTYPYEDARSTTLFMAALLAWFNPTGIRPLTQGWNIPDPSMLSYLDCVRMGIDSIEFCTGQSGGFLSGNWGQVQNGSNTLWYYALVFDILSSPNIQAYLEYEVMADLYENLADGIFHVLVQHMQSNYPGYSWNSGGYCGNNWTGREISGVGMAALAMSDWLSQENTTSQRYKDYTWALQYTQTYGVDFLTSNYDVTSGACYYYEGPHYLNYWAPYFMAWVQALSIANTNAPAMFPYYSGSNTTLTLGDTTKPLTEYLSGQLAILAQTAISGTTPVWSAMGLDDSWITGDATIESFMDLATWGPSASKQQWLDAAKRLYLQYPNVSNLCLGNTDMDTVMAGSPAPAALPNVQSLGCGINVARTGSTNTDLMVLLKNTPTPYDPGVTNVPSLAGHPHADNGNVVAYRGGEPVLRIPGYGANGDSGNTHEEYFTNWLAQNIPMIADPLGVGYPQATRTLIGEPSDYIILPRGFGLADPRADAATTITSSKGVSVYCLQTELITGTNQWTRFVLVPSVNSIVPSIGTANVIVIVDRLLTPYNVRLCWWGYGSTSNAVNGTAAPTFSIDGSGGLEWTAATNSKARLVSVLGTETYSTYGPATQIAGDYDSSWSGPDVGVTGAWLTSTAAVMYTATVVEINASTSWQNLTPQVTVNGSGVITAVGIVANGTTLDTYTLPTTAPAITNGPPPSQTALNVAYNTFTYTTTGYPTPTFSVSSGSLPTGLSLSSAGVLSGTPSANGNYTGTVSATNTAGTANQSFSITVAAGVAPTITNASSIPRTAIQNVYYPNFFTYTATGFPLPGPTGFKVTSGSLPPGLSLNPATGVISGTPTEAFTENGIVVTLNNGISPNAVTAAVSITVYADPAITNGPPPATGAVGTAYNFTYTATGTPAPTFSVTTGSLPAGLSLSTAGVISGTPTTANFYSGTVTATNTAGTYSQTFLIDISA